MKQNSAAKISQLQRSESGADKSSDFLFLENFVSALLLIS